MGFAICLHTCLRWTQTDTVPGPPLAMCKWCDGCAPPPGSGRRQGLTDWLLCSGTGNSRVSQRARKVATACLAYLDQTFRKPGWQPCLRFKNNTVIIKWI